MSIFITVGFESFPFNRLLKAIDQGIRDKLIPPSVFIQTGHSSYEPRYCPSKRFLRFDEIIDYLKKSEIIVSHAGVGTTLLALSLGKVPILFPRQVKYHEHVDDHQKEYARKMKELRKVLVATDGSDLLSKINDYDAVVARLRSDSSEEKPPSLKDHLEERLGGGSKEKARRR
jgi:UDP-N-acetylglucosamine transferase subunit ALG13